MTRSGICGKIPTVLYFALQLFVRGSVTIYGKLTLRERLFRAAVSALIGAAAGFVLMLRTDLLRRVYGESYLLPAALVGAALGGILGFRRTEIRS